MIDCPKDIGNPYNEYFNTVVDTLLSASRPIYTHIQIDKDFQIYYVNEPGINGGGGQS